MCVNIFLFAIHLLPTVPFDMRAFVFAAFARGSKNAQEPHVFRQIGSFNSHLAILMLGIGGTTAALGIYFSQEIVGWYGAVAAAVYLFVASQWEIARAEELEEQYVPTPTRIARRDSVTSPPLSPHVEFTSEELDAPLVDLAAQAHMAAEEEAELEPEPDVPDIDEILRKLHRDGADALTEDERQALLSASRQLNEKRAQSDS